MGLAIDYCVKFSALDAKGSGIPLSVIEDGCRGVELEPADVEHASNEMRQAEVKFVRSNSLS